MCSCILFIGEGAIIAFNSNIPQATDQLSVSQGQILGNFGSLNTWVNVDHTGLNAGNAGQHNKVTFPLQAMAPAFGGSDGLFSLNYTGTSTVGELWLNHRNGNQYPISASILSTSPSLASNSNGWCYGSSGTVLVWGRSNVVVGSNAINISAVFGTLAASFNAVITPDTTFSQLTITALSNTTLTVQSSAISICRWFVIGRE